MSFPDISSPDELLNEDLHEKHKEKREAQRILIIGHESVGRDLARLLIRKNFLANGVMPGIDIVQPDEIPTGAFGLNQRKCMPDIDVSDMFGEDQVLHTDERSLKELLKLSLDHKNQKTPNRGPEGRKGHSRLR